MICSISVPRRDDDRARRLALENFPVPIMYIFGCCDSWQDVQEGCLCWLWEIIQLQVLKHSCSQTGHSTFSHHKIQTRPTSEAFIKHPQNSASVLPYAGGQERRAVDVHPGVVRASCAVCSVSSNICQPSLKPLSPSPNWDRLDDNHHNGGMKTLTRRMSFFFLRLSFPMNVF